MNKFTLTLDDFAPHEKTGLGLEVIDVCDKLIHRYPDIKINLFVSGAYCRLGEKPRFLSRNVQWAKKISTLSKKNYRLGLHGMFHRRCPVDYKFHQKWPASNNDEFQFLNKSQASSILKRSIVEFDESGIEYSKVFRAPGWKISKSSAEVLTESGFVIAGNQQYYDILKDKVNGLRWISYNWDMVNDCDVPADKDVIAYGHTSSWTNNYMNKDRFKLIVKLLDSRAFSFKFIEELI